MLFHTPYCEVPTTFKMANMLRSLRPLTNVVSTFQRFRVKKQCIRNASVAVMKEDLASTCSAWKRNKRYEVKPSPEKIQIANEVVNVFKSNKMVAVIHWGNMTVREWDDLKYEFRMEDIQIKFFPNKIACKGLEKSDFKEAVPLFRSVNAVLCSKDVNVKGLLKVLKTQPKAFLVGAKVENRLLTAKGVEEYSKLPSILQLQGELLHIISGPAANTSQLLSRNQQQLSNILSQVAEGKGSKLS